jgi:hypothetical protein
LIGASTFLLSAIKLLILDSELLDLDDDHEENSGFNKELVDITLSSFENDDECEAKTWFKREAISSSEKGCMA